MTGIGRRGPVLLGLCLLWAAFVASGLVSAWRVDWPGYFDERAHFSYAATIAETGQWAPPLDGLLWIPDIGDGRAAEARNYLNHPPSFYLLVAGLIDAARGPGPSDLVRLRVASLMLGAAGIAVLMLLGLLLYGATPPAVVFGVMAVAVPQVQAIAAQVSNDSLVLLGGSSTLAGGILLVRTPLRIAGWALLAAGTLVAGITKLTAALACLTFDAALLLLMIKDGLRLLRPGLFLLAAAATLTMLPYAAFTVLYGSPAPHTMGQEMLLIVRTQLEGLSDRERLSLPVFVAYFLLQFLARIVPPHALSEAGLASSMPDWYALGYLPAGLILLAGIFGLWLGAAGRPAIPTAERVVMRAGLCALLVTLAANVLFAYGRHLDYGWLNDAQPRYLLPLFGLLPIAVSRFVWTLQFGLQRPAVLVLTAAAATAQLHLSAVRGDWP